MLLDSDAVLTLSLASGDGASLSKSVHSLMGKPTVKPLLPTASVAGDDDVDVPDLFLAFLISDGTFDGLSMQHGTTRHGWIRQIWGYNRKLWTR